MDDLNNLPLAMAYVPMQRWQGILEPAVGFRCGTLFSELVKPFQGRGVAQ
ncbi:MAG: spore coat associated protein CotJA [Eubacteriales bacterium]|nr:spore coat associated protein CotJA [Eubacteriales bacterium]